MVDYAADQRATHHSLPGGGAPNIHFSKGCTSSVQCYKVCVAANVGEGVETSVETALLNSEGVTTGIQVRMLAPLTIGRDGIALVLPASRKARSFRLCRDRPASVGRSRLCELL
jgi:hypothetical protein